MEFLLNAKQVNLNTSEDIDNLRNWLENLQDKERIVLKIAVYRYPDPVIEWRAGKAAYPRAGYPGSG